MLDICIQFGAILPAYRGIACLILPVNMFHRAYRGNACLILPDIAAYRGIAHLLLPVDMFCRAYKGNACLILSVRMFCPVYT